MRADFTTEALRFMLEPMPQLRRLFALLLALLMGCSVNVDQVVAEQKALCEAKQFDEPIAALSKLADKKTDEAKVHAALWANACSCRGWDCRTRTSWRQ